MRMICPNCGIDHGPFCGKTFREHGDTFDSLRDVRALKWWEWLLIPIALVIAGLVLLVVAGAAVVGKFRASARG